MLSSLDLCRKMILSILILFLTACTTNTGSFTQNAEIEEYRLGKDIQTCQDKKIVLVGGCFDLLHYGHIEFLKKAKETGQYLVVALESDEHIIRFKHRKPTHTQYQRAIILSSTRMVDKVILLPPLKGFKEYNQLTQDVKPNIIAITDNDPQFMNKKKQADAIGAIMIIVTNRIDSFSSTDILEKDLSPCQSDFK